MRNKRMCTNVFIAIVIASSCAWATDKIVIAHRGASGYLPEHTLPAYAAAYAYGADYIEPDCVMTRDGHLIALHDIHLEATTDVAERFPDRKRGDGRWYAADFTLAEIKTLQARERLPNRFPIGASRFEVPTLREVIELIQGMNRSTGRDVGIYPELKDPSWHRSQGLPMEEAMLAILKQYGYEGPQARIFIQCFEPATLRRIREELKSDLPMIQLIADSQKNSLATEAGLDAIAQYATGIGPDKRIVEENPAVVQWAHARGLKVHPYTLRKDTVPGKYDSFDAELRQYYLEYDVDGVFVDHPDDAVRVLDAWRATR